MGTVVSVCKRYSAVLFEGAVQLKLSSKSKDKTLRIPYNHELFENFCKFCESWDIHEHFLTVFFDT